MLTSGVNFRLPNPFTIMGSGGWPRYRVAADSPEPTPGSLTLDENLRQIPDFAFCANVFSQYEPAF